MFGKKEEDKYLDLTPELKKMYGKNWKLICAIDRNTKALEDILEQLKRINETLKRE